jgi:KaiC/GvpD/RAD55 family RecA-like ATPase
MDCVVNSAFERGFEGAFSPGNYRSLPTLDDVLASMPPPGERFATGFPTLDKVLRGGFVRRRVHTYVGPPGRGKTVMLKQHSVNAAQGGAIVIAFFCDEGDWQAAVMAAQGLGFDRKAVEDGYAAVRAEVQARSCGFDLYFPNPDAHDTVLDSVDIWLKGRDPDRQVVIVGDSVQKLRVSADVEMPPTRKERADAVMTAARRIAERHDAIMLLASKANRASWSSKNPNENLDSLAAGMDSSSIEYDSDVLFFLSGDPSKRTFLHVRKNRPGDGTLLTIALGFDRTTATFAEIDQEVAQAEAEEQEQSRAEAAWSADEKKVLETVRRFPGRSQRALRPLARIGSNRLAAVLEELERKGHLEHLDKGWRLVESVTGERERE